MSSTDGTRVRDALGQFFDEVLSPLAASMKALGQEAFPLGANATCQSYYVTRVQPAMSRQDFISSSCLDFADLEPQLSAHWQALGRTELLGAVPRLRVLAQAAQEARALAGDSPELSPDFYIMF